MKYFIKTLDYRKLKLDWAYDTIQKIWQKASIEWLR